jgi:small subunit ribosomal protein S1
VPLSELSWTRRPLHPAELLHAGQEAEFVVLELEPERQRLVLSLRRTQPNPWEEAAARYPVGSRISVQVRRVTETAAIVETAEGIEGILPAAELSWARTRPAPAALLSPGQSLEVVVLELLPQQQRLVVSLRQALPNPWTEAPQRYPAGSRIQGTVLRLTLHELPSWRSSPASRGSSRSESSPGLAVQPIRQSCSRQGRARSLWSCRWTPNGGTFC